MSRLTSNSDKKQNWIYLSLTLILGNVGMTGGDFEIKKVSSVSLIIYYYIIHLYRSLSINTLRQLSN